MGIRMSPVEYSEVLERQGKKVDYGKLAEPYIKGDKPKPSKEKESDIQKAIKDYLQVHGYFVVKIHQSLGSYKGIADLYAIKNGRHMWVEVKTSRGKLSDWQKQFKYDIEQHGGFWTEARSVEDIASILRDMGD